MSYYMFIMVLNIYTKGPLNIGLHFEVKRANTTICVE